VEDHLAGCPMLELWVQPELGEGMSRGSESVSFVYFWVCWFLKHAVSLRLQFFPRHTEKDCFPLTNEKVDFLHFGGSHEVS
jgi:hypothetical protein